MSNNIGWCDCTINPVVGCTKCSPGCTNCYTEKFAARLAKNPATAKKYAGVVDAKGKWTGEVNVTMDANSPDVVKAHIDEILRLRSLVEQHEEYIANLELEAASTDNKIDSLAVLLGITPDTGDRRIMGIIKGEILRLRAKLDWITLAAARSLHGCPPEEFQRAECDGDCLACWREAARKAAEKKE